VVGIIGHSGCHVIHGKRHSGKSLRYVVGFLCVVTLALGAQTAPSPKALSEEDVIKLLQGNVAPERVEKLVRERGIDFQVTADTSTELRNAGATDALLAALREKAPVQPISIPASTIAGKPPSQIQPILTTNANFAIPGTGPIGPGLIDNATENVNKAVEWLNPLIRGGRGQWQTLLSYQPRKTETGLLAIRFSVSPPPPSPTAAPELVMSKSPTGLSIGIPAEHYQDAGAVFQDLLELFISNLPPQARAAHNMLVQQIKRTAAEFQYPGDPLPPEVLTGLVGSSGSQAKALDAETPDTGTSAGIYDGDIQGRVIGSTVKCFNFLLNNGVPYLTRLQRQVLQKAKASSAAGDAETATYLQGVANTIAQDIRTINAFLVPLPSRLRVEFYIKPGEQTSVRGKLVSPAKIPDPEPGVRLVIALPREAYYSQGPSAVKDALTQELSKEAGGLPIQKAVDDFFLLYGADPANKDTFVAVTMRQLHPQADESLGTLAKLWPAPKT